MRASEERFARDGFVVLPAHLSRDDLAPALAGLERSFPSADAFHDDVDPARNHRFRDEFGGILAFPFADSELSLLAVHPKLVALAERLLESEHLRAYSIEAWAKYTGAARYEQAFHRDYLNHTLLAPEPGRPARQVEMFLYLGDVPLALGPPSQLPLAHTRGLPALPNWHPREDGPEDPEQPSWRATRGRPDLYEHEQACDGPAGTVVAYRIETFHRGTELTLPRGARYTLHVSLRAAADDWIGRRAWVEVANEPSWHAFVLRASPRQLALFGFPPPGHAYWTAETLAGVAQRYPGLDVSPWRRP